MKRWIRVICTVCIVVLLAAGCGRVSKEMLERREQGISLLESGDYEGAVEVFEGLIEDAKHVSDFELDVLKYRAEAEFCYGDYEAAAYTYGLLNEVDEKRAEYCYFGALSLARAGNTAGAEEWLRAGYALDGKAEQPGFDEAVLALGEAFAREKDYSKADDVYEAITEIGHGGAEIYRRRLLLAMEQGEFQRALSLTAEGMALAEGDMKREFKFYEAVCHEYLGEYGKALELFLAYEEEFGSDAAVGHEIAFLKTR